MRSQSSVVYHFGPEYYLPDEEEPFIQEPSQGNENIGIWQPVVYPNPSDGNILFLFIPFGLENTPDTFELFDINGRLIYSYEVRKGKNVLNPNTMKNGAYYYHLRKDEESIKAGMICVSPK
jgi:hypothetical protein